ncbi:MAG: phenylacetate--CoA ligase family protein [Clostridiales bacterium]|nr:phenylacetate--CoA ligase family protein [Clostridiales bacterium]
MFIEKILYPLMEKRRGNRVRENTLSLKESEKYTAAQLKEYQSERLSELLVECVKNVPKYQGVAISEKDILYNPYEALKKFPVTKKSDVVKDKESFVNKTYARSSLIENNTGGSTGEPLRFYMDRKAVEQYEAARFRGLSWYDISFGSRSVMLWGNPVEMTKNEDKKYRLREKYLKNRIMLPAYNLKPDKLREYVEIINRYKPEYIYGYSSMLDTMAKMFEAQNLKLKISLKAVVSTSETLTQEQRENIGRVFSCSVVNEYGARDAGILAYECPNGAMHIIEENVYVEILDPVTLKEITDGSVGLIAVTDLTNYAMPRLRYILGDIGSLSSDTCDCGRSSRLFSSIEGREDALLVKRDGTLVHGHIVNHFAKLCHGIKQFRFVQKSVEYAELIVVKKESETDDCDKFVSDIKEAFPGLEVNVAIAEDIPAAKSGKMKYTIREFPLN